MNKSIFNFIKSVIYVGLTILCVCVATLLYNMSDNIQIDTYFFRPDRNFIDRPGIPATPADLEPSNKMRMMLLDNYISKVFGVTPYEDTQVKEKIASQITSPATREYLEQNIWPETRKLAADKVLRTATVESMTPEPGSKNYWHVRTKFTTWRTPNDFSQEPDIQYEDWSVAFMYRNELRPDVAGFTIEQYLENGIMGIPPNPAWVFYFYVTDIKKK